MRFTNSPYEKMMQQKGKPSGEKLLTHMKSAQIR